MESFSDSGSIRENKSSKNTINFSDGREQDGKTDIKVDSVFVQNRN